MTGAPGSNELAARGVCVRLGGAPVLRSVSVTARGGEVTGVIGPNGAGKSTLLRVLAGVLRAESGSVWLGGADLDGVRTTARARRVAYLPQQDAAQPFTALETVLMGRYPFLRRFQLEGQRDRRIARAAMARTETERFEPRGLDRLSGGERQRVLLARALAQQAGVLVLDEPLASLDLRHRLAVLASLRVEAARGAAVVVALHDVELAGRYCDRLILLAGGAMAACGVPEEVLVPDNFRAVFGVEAVISQEPATGQRRVWLVGPSACPGAALHDGPAVAGGSEGGAAAGESRSRAAAPVGEPEPGTASVAARIPGGERVPGGGQAPGASESADTANTGAH